MPSTSYRLYSKRLSLMEENDSKSFSKLRIILMKSLLLIINSVENSFERTLIVRACPVKKPSSPKLMPTLNDFRDFTPSSQ